MNSHYIKPGDLFVINYATWDPDDFYLNCPIIFVRTVQVYDIHQSIVVITSKKMITIPLFDDDNIVIISQIEDTVDV